MKPPTPAPYARLGASPFSDSAADKVAALEAQIADLKQLVALLQAQIADVREQKDKWQGRAERISLVLPC